MSDRRAQWIRFYEAALAGATRSSLCAPEQYDVIATDAERIADAAMARLDARDFPPSKVEALISAAAIAWGTATVVPDGQCVSDHHMAALGKALAALKEQS